MKAAVGEHHLILLKQCAEFILNIAFYPIKLHKENIKFKNKIIDQENPKAVNKILYIIHK